VYFLLRHTPTHHSFILNLEGKFLPNICRSELVMVSNMLFFGKLSEFLMPTIKFQPKIADLMGQNLGFFLKLPQGGWLLRLYYPSAGNFLCLP
jgi:hypothetical protein